MEFSNLSLVQTRKDYICNFLVRELKRRFPFAFKLVIWLHMSLVVLHPGRKSGPQPADLSTTYSLDP